MVEVEEQLRRHARWVRPQMAPLVLPADTLPPLAVEPRPPTGRPSRRIWLLVGAAALVVLLAATVAVVSTRSGPAPSGPASPTGPNGSIVATGPQIALVPTWLPSGLRLLRVTTERPGEIPYPHDLFTGPYAEQLFGAGGQPLVEIKIEPTYGGLISWGGANTAVRGHPANNSDEAHPNRQLRWIERGALVTVTAKPSLAGRLRAFLAGLRWAGLEPTDGFVAPVGSTLTPLAPTYLSADGGVGLNASFVYAPSASSERQLDVFTCPDGIGDCSGLSYDNYLDVWFHGHRNADGSATADPSGGAAGSYMQAWPRGGAVDVETDGVPLDPNELARLVAGLRLTGPAGLAGLRGQITQQALALPVLVSQVLRGDRVELRGTRYGPWSLCIETPRQPLTCPQVTGPLPSSKMALAHGFTVDPSSYRELDLSILVDGHWVVAAVTVRHGATLSFPILKNGEIPGPAVNSPASTSSVTVGTTTYHLGLAEPPDSAYSVGIVENTASGSASGGAYRPGF